MGSIHALQTERSLAMALLGIDVSHYQGDVDWHAVARSEVRFAYIKATEGSALVDPTFRNNWMNTRDTGLLHGAYHFAHPGQPAESQAVHFASVLGAPSFGELPPALDLELMDGVGAGAVVQWTLTFLRKAEALLGRSFVIYTGGLWRRQLGDPIVPELQNHMLWTARYSLEQPVLPKNWKRWDFWQFTDGQSGEVVHVPGVRGACDCNRFRGDLAELQALTAPASLTHSTSPVSGTPSESSASEWPGEHWVWPSQPPMRSVRVRDWQARLLARGFALTVDGVYGPQSKIACVAFQREMGLPPDGIVGPQTWHATFDTSVV
jgi:lysozyme